MFEAVCGEREEDVLIIALVSPRFPHTHGGGGGETSLNLCMAGGWVVSPFSFCLLLLRLWVGGRGTCKKGKAEFVFRADVISMLVLGSGQRS